MAATLFEALERRVLLSGDDHADFGDWDNATELIVVYEDSDIFGSIFALDSGSIEAPGDTDVFRLVSPVDATQYLLMAGSTLSAPILPAGFRLYRRDPDTGSVDLIGAPVVPPNESGTLVLGQDYGYIHENDELFFVVEAGTQNDFADSPIGDYNLLTFLWFDQTRYNFTDVQQTGGGGDDGGANVPDDDRPDATDPVAAGARIALTPLDGRGVNDGEIEFAEDTDLFRFEATATGLTTVRLENPVFQGTLRVVNADGAVIGSYDALQPREEIVLTVPVIEHQTYGVIVGTAGVTTGTYGVEVETLQSLFHLFHPEGYSSPAISEFVPIVNPTDAPVTYTVIARYEWGVRDQVLRSGVIAPHTRGGITISTSGDNPTSKTIEGIPYAIEIIADGPISATLSHYDFGVTTGESFTSSTSQTWTFPLVQRQHDRYRDFVVFYNPNNAPADVTVTLLPESGPPIQITKTLEPHRRGGINIDANPAIGVEGRFGVVVASDLPVVAALSSYDFVNQSGYGVLGEPSAGTFSGVIPLIDPFSSSILVMNTAIADSAVRLTYLSSTGQAPVTRDFVVGARSTLTLDPSLLNSPLAGYVAVTFESELPVTVMATREANGDAEAMLAAGSAAFGFLFGDAFINVALAGTDYLETLALANPGSASASAEVRFVFVDGTTETISIDVAAGGLSVLDLHETDAIIDRGGLVPFSIEIVSDAPIVAGMTHYDGFLEGGWSTLGTPILGLADLSRL